MSYYYFLLTRLRGVESRFHILFMMQARLVGLMAHWKEAMMEAGPKIWRPQQLYVGKMP